MTWDYRIVKYKSGDFGLHEIFYDENQKVENWTESAVDFKCWEDEGHEGIIKSLEMALECAKTRPILNEEELP